MTLPITSVLGAGTPLSGAARTSAANLAKTNAAAKAFEQMLVNELTKEMATAMTSDAQNADGSASGGSSSASPSSGMDQWSGLISDTLSSSIEKAGGLGVAKSLSAGTSGRLGSVL